MGKNATGGVDQAALILRRDAETLISREALQELATLHLGNDRVGALDDALRSGKAIAKLSR